VFVEHDGATALARVQRESPKVCLLDIGLPDMDGFELARRIRAQPAMAQAVLIALTGYGRDEDRQRSLDAGFNLHRVKPIDPDELSALVMWSPAPQEDPVTRE
jgi:CheY-like chemotaxis protein